MLYIVVVTYLKPIEEVDRLLVAHRKFLGIHYASGQFIASGPQNPRTGGVIISKGASREEVLNLLKEDPFNLNGIARYEVIEFDPVLYHDSFKPLIS